ncbi:MAG: hypothetical protein AAGJ38_07550 [Planctomycetota bacterium]
MPSEARPLSDLVTEHTLTKPPASMPADLSKQIDAFNRVCEIVLEKYDRAIARIDGTKDFTEIGRSNRRAEAAERARWDLFRDAYVPAVQILDQFESKQNLPGPDDTIGRPDSLPVESAGMIGSEVRSRLATMKSPERVLLLKQIADRTDPAARAVLFAVDGGDALRDTPLAAIPTGDLRAIRERHHRARRPQDFAAMDQLGHARQTIAGNFAIATRKVQGGEALPALWQRRLKAGEIKPEDERLAAFIQ